MEVGAEAPTGITAAKRLFCQQEQPHLSGVGFRHCPGEKDICERGHGFRVDIIFNELNHLYNNTYVIRASFVLNRVENG